MSVLSLEKIIEVVSLLILSIFRLRCVNKWLQKRKVLKIQWLQSLIKHTRKSTTYIHEIPAASAPFEAWAIMEPQHNPKHKRYTQFDWKNIVKKDHNQLQNGHTGVLRKHEMIFVI